MELKKLEDKELISMFDGDIISDDLFEKVF